jgi:hypothetical protein
VYYDRHVTDGTECKVSVAKTQNPGCDRHANDHGHMRVYAWLGNIKRAVHGPDWANDWPVMHRCARWQQGCSVVPQVGP